MDDGSNAVSGEVRDNTIWTILANVSEKVLNDLVQYYCMSVFNKKFGSGCTSSGSRR